MNTKVGNRRHTDIIFRLIISCNAPYTLFRPEQQIPKTVQRRCVGIDHWLFKNTVIHSNQMTRKVLSVVNKQYSVPNN